MSDDSLGFDPVDDELRRRLGAAGPRPGDPDVTLGALRPRYRRAKRRHQLVVAAGSACVVAVLIGVGAAVVSAGGSDPQNVRIPPANSSTPTSPVPSTVDSTPPTDRGAGPERRRRRGARSDRPGRRDVDGAGRADDAHVRVERWQRHREGRQRRAVDRVDAGCQRILGGEARHGARSCGSPLHEQHDRMADPRRPRQRSAGGGDHPALIAKPSWVLVRVLCTQPRRAP